MIKAFVHFKAHEQRVLSNVLTVTLFSMLLWTWSCVIKGNLQLAGVSTAVLVALLSILLWVSFKETDAQRRRYFDYLRTLEVKILKRASVSPELQAFDRQLIIQFLNKQYPGWSLEDSAS